jgi:hypothetical protein
MPWSTNCRSVPPYKGRASATSLSSGSLAMFAAIRLASSRVSRLAAEIDISERLAVLVLHDEAGAVVLYRPGRRKRASSRRSRLAAKPGFVLSNGK